MATEKVAPGVLRALPRPVEHHQRDRYEGRRRLNRRPSRAVRHDSRTNRAHFGIWSGIVWTIWVLMAAALILALCAAVWVVA